MLSTNEFNIYEKQKQSMSMSMSCQSVYLVRFQLMGHSCKIGNMRHPGTVKNQNPHLEKLCKFCLSFRFLYHIQ